MRLIAYEEKFRSSMDIRICIFTHLHCLLDKRFRSLLFSIPYFYPTFRQGYQ